jgi:hypothetical protein
LEYLTTYYKSKIKPCVRNCLPFVNKLWKESLNSDDHQFYQYQQNEQSPSHFN